MKMDSVNKLIPMLDLKVEYEYMKDDIDKAIQRCLDHQQWILGPEVKELEDRVAEYIGAKHCIGVSSGTEALVLSLRALAIKLKGKEYFDRTDEIITTPFTFTATGDAILRAGATPVFVDIDPHTFNIDPEGVRLALKDERPDGRIVGMIPVHLYGQPCDMDEIAEISNKKGLFMVEDVAQAFGANWKEQKLGSIGVAGAFSFFPSKNLGGFGDGGMISTNDDEIAAMVRMLTKHGGKDKYNVEHIGYNARMDTLQAAILLAKLKHIDDFNKRRRQIAELYTAGLSGIYSLQLPVYHDAYELPIGHVYHQYTVRTNKRDDLQAFLKDRGVSSMVYYPVPLHKMKVFGGRSRITGNLINSEQAAKEVLSLPIEPLLPEDHIEYVVNRIKEFPG